MIFLREGRWVCKACATAKWRCAMAGGDTIKVSQKKDGGCGERKQQQEEAEEEGGG